MSKYTEFIERKRREYGDKFDDSDLAGEFVPWFNSGERVMIKSRFDFEEAVTGTIGVTTGWRPTFLLMRRSNAMGSSYTLSSDDHVIAFKRGDKYVSLKAAIEAAISQ